MRSLPTFAAMPESDPERAIARRQLRQQLRLLRESLGPAARSLLSGEVSAWDEANWDYFASAPARAADGTICYLHFFRHGKINIGGAPLSLTIAASDGWWPLGCTDVPPPHLGRTTASRPRLRLVS